MRHRLDNQTPFVTINDRLLAEIDAGVIPWHHLGKVPMNVRSGHFYSGANGLLLAMASAKRPALDGTWATYPTWQELGSNVKLEEHGQMCIRWTAKRGQVNQYDQPRWFTLFDQSQVTEGAMSAKVVDYGERPTLDDLGLDFRELPSFSPLTFDLSVSLLCLLVGAQRPLSMLYIQDAWVDYLRMDPRHWFMCARLASETVEHFLAGTSHELPLIGIDELDGPMVVSA